jgi:VCBS repeat-containing protein
MAVSTVSYSKTPQAGDDVYSWQENDYLSALNSSGSVLLDVMSNDLGGNAKQLYSIDNGDALKDLLTKDPGLCTAWETTAGGNQMRINNGKIEFKLADGFNLNTLAEGQGYADSFTYSIQLGNGTISCATVKLNFIGQNDAAILSSASASLQETNDALTTSGTLTVSDVDSSATFQALTDVAGAHGKFSINAAGQWTYTANEAYNGLNVGQSVSDTFTVRSADGTATSVKVTINGTNDAAVLSSAVVALNETNAALTTGGTLTITDVDSAATFQAQTDVAGANGKFSIDTAGNWTYTANEAFDGLNVGQSASDTFTVVSADGTATTVKVTINGTNDAAVLSSATVELSETNAALTTGGTLTNSDVDNDDTFVPQTDVAGANGKFSVDAAGAWTYTANSAFDALNVGDSVSDTFTVSAADGTTTTVKVTIKGTNDAAVLSSAALQLDETDEALTTGGQLTNSDVDDEDTFVAQNDVQGSHGKFSIGTDGIWSYTADEAYDGLNLGDSVSDMFTIAAADGTTTTVRVTINGTNDAAVLSSAVVDLDETNAALTTSGRLTITDVDSPEAFVVQSETHGVHGKFSVDADGTWSYTADETYDGLNVGNAVSDTFTVAAADGTLTSVMVTIHGTNDAAVLSSAVVELEETDAALTTGGQLTNNDVDNEDTFVAQSDVQGLHGKFSIGTDGTWAYTADSAYDHLNVNDSVSDTFSVAAADGTPTSVKVTIKGTNDAAVLSSAAITLDETDSALTTDGTLTNQDVDNDDTFVAQTNIAGDHGQFSIDAAGHWTYAANEAFDGLNVGDSVADTFSVEAADGTLTSVKVTIMGTNDAAVLSSDVVELSETNDALTTTGTLTISDVDSAESFQAQTDVVGANGTFSIDEAGDWTYTAKQAFDGLNVGHSVSDTFTVLAADGTATSVRVTINGTNDAAVLSSATVALNETDAALTTNGTLTISDVDSPETFVPQNDVAGTNGKFSIDAAGAWSYTANGAFDSLNVGQSVSDTFTVQSSDGTSTAVEVTINGTNDAAVLSSAVESINETNAALSTHGALTISDVDSPESFVAQDGTQGNYGKFSIGSDGSWSYAADSAYDELNVDDALTDTFTVAAADGTLTSVKVTINGTNDAAVLSSATVALDETNMALTTGGTLTNQDVDNADTFVVQSAVEGTYGKFSIDAAGQWTYTANEAFDELNVGGSVEDSFTVHAADGTTTSVKVTIDGTNDAAVLSSAVVSLGETNAALTTTGTLTISDVDSDETFVAQADVAGDNGKFSIDAAGSWTYTANEAFDGLNVGQSVTDTFTVHAADGTASSVKVTIHGTNDAAVVTSADVPLNETNAVLTTGGTLTNSDVDDDDTFVAQTDVAGANGKFSIDEDGAWTYTANSAFDNLNVGSSVSDTFTVHAADGTATSVKVTINGTNDAAVLSSAIVALNETNAALTTGGTLTITDVDSAQIFQTQTNVEGTNGKFSIDAAGAWTYTANSAFNGLNVGSSVTDTFTVKAADGTESSVKVTINGTNDAAVLSSADVTLAETNAPLTTGGTLTVTDVDSSATFQVQSNVAGSNGKFSIDANGAWTYTANSAFDNLNVGDSISDTFTVKSFDGTSTTVKVTINGTADGPVAAPAVFTGTGDTNDFDTKDIANINSAAVNFTGSGNSNDTVYGSNLVDKIDGKNGVDKIYGFGGNDDLQGGPGVDEIYGGAGDDAIVGGSEVDTIYGGSGNDSISGDSQADIIFGGAGNDIIVGNAGADIIVGGFGADTLTGGTVDADTFRYLDIRDTGDTITDFVKADGDKIDFAAIDTGTLGFTANTTVLASHSVITFFNTVSNQTIVQVDTDGNASTAELQIQLTGNIGLTATDFVL